MSGSPTIQDGKLTGRCHPHTRECTTSGYGFFTETHARCGGINEYRRQFVSGIFLSHIV
ncbi:MAG: hypothetical protein IJ412_08760 [Oscillospiraceae bacterium]|nr:hypothetical protein [Oscillospiraceae bacterium]